MTPLYLAWVASYALEIGALDDAAASARLEKVALAFEEAKPYALSRWRWPDRFDP
jgi:glucosylglycerate synthase